MQFKQILLLTAISGSALADFFIGNCASADLDAKPGVEGIALPGGEVDCDYVAVPENGKICDQDTTLSTTNDGGICPGNEAKRSLNFCSAALPGSGCPNTFQMGFSMLESQTRQWCNTDCSADSRDDCGDIALADKKLPSDGVFYSDLIDTARQNIAVGRCVYEQAKGGEIDCPGSDDGQKKCATFIRCYTAQYGTTEC